MAFCANMQACGEIVPKRAVHPGKQRDSDGARGNAQPSNRIRQRNQGPQDPFRPDQIRPERRDSNQAGDYSQSDVQLALDPPNPARLKRLPVAVDPHDESSDEDRPESDAKRRVDVLAHQQQSITAAVHVRVERAELLTGAAERPSSCETGSDIAPYRGAANASTRGAGIRPFRQPHAVDVRGESRN